MKLKAVRKKILGFYIYLALMIFLKEELKRFESLINITFCKFAQNRTRA